MTDQPSSDADEAIAELVEANEVVTDLLMRVAEGKSVDPTELKHARQAELMALNRYIAARISRVLEIASGEKPDASA